MSTKFIVEAKAERGAWVPAVRGTYNATGKNDWEASCAGNAGEAHAILNVLVELGDERAELRVRELDTSANFYNGLPGAF